MSETLPSSFLCRYRQVGVTALLAAVFLMALLWAGGALPAQAKKGGVPAAPQAGSDPGSQGNGQGQGQGQGAVGVAEIPVAVPESGSLATAPPPPDPALAGGSPDGGANSTLGPYDPDPAKPEDSGVGQPSGNGKSTDNNGNRPCAGCVGKADYKNPPGQLPDGNDDGNKGYECDKNEGVGKMNPAHSGCARSGPPSVTSPPPPPAAIPPAPAVTPPEAPPPESRPPEARAEERGEVQGVEQEPDLPATPPAPPVPAALPVSAVVTAAAGKPEELPFTGGQPLFLGLLGLLSLVAGLGLARLLRIRQQA